MAKAKSAKTKTAKAVAATASAPKGRQAASSGMKIKKLVKIEETGFREGSKAYQCYALMKDGAKVETYRESAEDSKLALKVLRDCVGWGFVELT